MRALKTLEALFPGTRHGVLRALYLEPGRWWSLGDLASYLETRPSLLRRDISVLSVEGVLRRQRNGQRTFFQPNPKCPFFAELQGMVAKTAGREDGTGTILLVEDEPATLKISRILLESWGYRVLEAKNAGEAIEIFNALEIPVSLLLTDVIMPGMSGPELAERLRKLQPDLRVVFMSGYPSAHLQGKNAAFLPKPFSPDRLARMVQAELKRR